MKNEAKIEELREKALHRISKYSRLFATAEGKEVLADLEDLFMNRTSVVKTREGTVDPNATLVCEGGREVILFIREQIKLGANNET